MKQTQRKRTNVGTASIAKPTVQDSAAPSALLGNDEDEELPVSNSGIQPSPVISVAMPPTPSDSQVHMYELSASCTVRDSIALKSSLLDLLMDQRPVTIDVRAVERIDTAALQVLCAFVRDRKAAGGKVFWVGCTESFCEAICLLGLQQVLDVPDAQLIGAAA
jgi:anti-anti-sigma regulatory factor